MGLLEMRKESFLLNYKSRHPLQTLQTKGENKSDDISRV